jgi:NAD-dependent DNA ligase
VHAFAAIDGISEEQATALVNSGFHTLEDLLQVELDDLSEIPEVGDDAATILESVKTETQRRVSTVEEEESPSESDS